MILRDQNVLALLVNQGPGKRIWIKSLDVLMEAVDKADGLKLQQAREDRRRIVVDPGVVWNS